MHNNERYHIKRELRTFEQVALQIVRYIQEENISPGSRIPAERKLSELLEISRSSVREGLRVLELLGYLDSKQGGGTYVSKPELLIIPYQLINVNVNKEDLPYYFHVFLMCTEKIITSFILDRKEGVNFNQITIKNSSSSFWEDLASVISYLLLLQKNTYVGPLWLNLYTLLKTNHYFQEINTNQNIEAIKHAINNHDLLNCLKLFHEFSLSTPKE